MDGSVCGVALLSPKLSSGGGGGWQTVSQSSLSTCGTYWIWNVRISFQLNIFLHGRWPIVKSGELQHPLYIINYCTIILSNNGDSFGYIVATRNILLPAMSGPWLIAAVRHHCWRVNTCCILLSTFTHGCKFYVSDDGSLTTQWR